ncbi:MAG: hypothetical protein ACR2KK_01340 [Acidimicrobiales bacterium]
MTANRVVSQLAVLEGRMLLRHPAVIVGAGFVLLMVATNLGSPWEADAYSALGGLGAATLGPFALLAANGARQRSRRDQAEELLSTLPTPAGRRTTAHLWSVLGGVALAVAGTVATALAYRLGDIDVSRWPNVAELAQGPLAVACAAILGVVLARWLPWPGVAAMAAIGVVVWQVSTPWFGPLVTLAEADTEGRIVGLSTGSAWWHLIWLAGWAGLGIAAARCDRRRDRAAAAAVGLVVLVIAGTAQLA